jgi:perosamine synthetase
MDTIAIEGGKPVRDNMLPYGRQILDAADIALVTEVMLGDWLTTGPMVGRFEEAFAHYVGAEHAVAVNSGTAALHAAVHVLNIKPGDEVIVPAMTFAASANCVLYLGGKAVFADVDPGTLLLDPAQVEAHITPRTKAIISVDYAGQPCDYDALRLVAQKYGLPLVADACHAPGGLYKSSPVGTLADLNTFSFHPVKHLTTAEGGMITTNDAGLADRMRWFRNHGITTDHRQRSEQGGWFYEMKELGYNYRLPDLNCALGLSQLSKLDMWVVRRREIADRYVKAFARLNAVRVLAVRPDCVPSWHIFPILLQLEELRADRARIFSALRSENIGVNVHYIPVYWHPVYRELGYSPGVCPITEDAYQRLITLPLFAGMTDQDVYDVIAAVTKVIEYYQL